MHLRLLPIFVALTAGHVIREEGERSKDAELVSNPFDAKSSQSEEHRVNGDCEKIVKDGNMICMLCKDPKSNGKYEQCSYTHRPKDKVYKFSRSKSFGATPEDESIAGEAIAGEAIAGEAIKRSTVGPGRAEGSETRVELDRQKASSPDCHEIVKDSMTCTVCKDPKTNANYEKCTYSHRPKEKVYQFSRSKSFGRNPHSDESAEDSPATTLTSASSYQTNDSGIEKSSPYRYNFGSSASFSPSEPVPFNRHYLFGGDRFRSDEIQLEDHTEKKASASDEGEDGTVPLADYHLGDESKNEPAEFNVQDERSEKGYGNSKRKEFEMLLRDFNEKDRSKCQRVMKDKMACYKCTDETGVHKEECMFVGETETKKQPDEGGAYTELKEYRYEPTESRRTLEPMAAASAQSRTVHGEASSTGKQNEKRKKASGDWESPKKRRNEKEFEAVSSSVSDEGISPQVDEAEQEVEPYEFVAETRPMYDKVLGISLPAYMLTKSEDEIEFDRMVEASRS